MYQVKVKTDGKEYLLHEPRDTEGELQLISPVVTLEMGKNGTFKFRIAPTHLNKDKILPLKSEISVYDDGELLFRGRPIGDESDFWLIGSVTCEGELAYLIDTIQRPYTYTGSTVEFVRQLVSVHNSQAGTGKQFAVGNVTVADTAPDVLRESDECKNTLKTMREQLTDKNGGYLRVRTDGGIRYLDYVSDYGGINSQVIRYGENLADLTCTVKPTSIITALIPRGAEIESEDTESDVRSYVDITSVNNGKDYIYDQSAVDAYGWVWGAQTFDDAADPEALLAKARAYLQECIALPETLELTAVDLNLVDADVQKLKLGYWTQVESVPHKISKRFMLTKREIHLDDPGKDKIVLGKTRPRFTESTNKDQNAISDRIDRVAASTSREINRKVENATQLITGGKGGYVALDVEDPDTGEKMHPWRILIMNTPDKETATNVIQLNQNGIGFSTTGINGPYRNAWTIDGNLLADFITTGTMVSERVRGGTYEVGGSGLAKDGQIVVKDASGSVIGSWDKTGLSVLRGILQGVSAVFGGVNNQNGAIEVRNSSGRMIGRWDKDGLYISNGVIDVGPLYADEDGGQLGDYHVSTDGSNILASNDGTVTIQTAAGGPFGSYPTICLSGKSGTTTLSDHHLETLLVIAGDIHLSQLEAEYGNKWVSVSKNIIELWNRVIDLENSL